MTFCQTLPDNAGSTWYQTLPSWDKVENGDEVPKDLSKDLSLRLS